MALTQDQVKKWCTDYGYTEDRFGHFIKIKPAEGAVPEQKYRVRISRNAVRKERQVKLSTGNRWFRMRSGYLKNLTLTPDNKLLGLTAAGCHIQDLK